MFLKLKINRWNYIDGGLTKFDEQAAWSESKNKEKEWRLVKRNALYQKT
jgi:hypothetical protein